MRDGVAGQLPRRAQVDLGRLLRLLSCLVFVCGAEVAALADFSVPDIDEINKHKMRGQEAPLGRATELTMPSLLIVTAGIIGTCYNSLREY
ncbi:hypothetical protein WISP_61172 [Willisornis vidua]|uniref:Uncharacterized protein n=1 Tax=Willisornis vidua TaxID=1566151 RepID=A0ABQ9DAH1_9PASS|nr:hypothetical protein WISP_61172 [Willisornis vidua]